MQVFLTFYFNGYTDVDVTVVDYFSFPYTQFNKNLFSLLL